MANIGEPQRQYTVVPQQIPLPLEEEEPAPSEQPAGPVPAEQETEEQGCPA